jgi:hypothetical protein
MFDSQAVPQLRRLVVNDPGSSPGQIILGFVVDKLALGQVFSEYFGFPYQFSFHRLLHAHHLSSGAGTIGQALADVPSGLTISLTGLTPPQEKKRKRTGRSEQKHENLRTVGLQPAEYETGVLASRTQRSVGFGI